MPLRPLGNPRVSVDFGNGWEELAGVTHVAIDLQHQPVDLSACPGYDPPDPVVDGYGMGEIRGIFATVHTAHVATPLELALSILAPHLALEPLYRGV